MDVSIVIPVYNEEKNISPLRAEISAVMEKLVKTHEIIFVNDGSTDGTLEELKKEKQSDSNVKIISFTRNYGQTAAIMAGFERSQGNVVITMDGDLQNDPHDIPALLEKISLGFDVISGWRKNRKDSLLLRVLPSKIANRIISMTLKVPLHDYGCTLKAYKRDFIKALHLYGEMHRFIPAFVSRKGAKIAEIEVNHRPRKFGRTKYGLARIGRVMLDLLLVAFL
ncbi:MAG: glycosyltransferase family 2 protein, partial [Candidatus Omnitrophota bacterium]